MCHADGKAVSRQSISVLEVCLEERGKEKGKEIVEINTADIKTHRSETVFSIELPFKVKCFRKVSLTNFKDVFSHVNI